MTGIFLVLPGGGGFELASLRFQSARQLGSANMTLETLVALQTSLETNICAPISRDQPNVKQLIPSKEGTTEFTGHRQPRSSGSVAARSVKRTSETLEILSVLSLARWVNVRQLLVAASLSPFSLMWLAPWQNQLIFFLSRFVGDLATLQSFVQNFGTLNIGCRSEVRWHVRAVAGLDVVSEIVKVELWLGRVQAKYEHPCDYIDDLADRCTLYCEFIAASGSCRLRF
jgi:hypothetical protein